MKHWLVVLAIAGCGKGNEAVSSGSSAPVAKSGSSVGSGSSGGSGSSVGSGSVGSGSADPRCGEECLFLADTAIEKLPEVYEKACGKPPETTLYSDQCKELDYLRNCIFAMHGSVPKGKKWKVFATKPWFHANAGFKPDQLSSIEAGNVHALHQQGKACKKGSSVSAADRDRFRAWVKAANAGKATWPTALFYNGDTLSLEGAKQTFVPAVDLAKGAISYTSPSMEVEGALPDQKLRGILYDYTPKCGSDMCDSISFTVVFDDHDKVVAFEPTGP